MEVPKSLSLEFLLRFAESEAIPDLAKKIRENDGSAIGKLLALFPKAEEFYWTRYWNGEGDAELGHLGWFYVAAGNFAEKVLGRQKAIPAFYEAFKAFDHLGGKAREADCKQILNEYPELKQNAKKYPEVKYHLLHMAANASTDAQ